MGRLTGGDESSLPQAGIYSVLRHCVLSMAPFAESKTEGNMTTNRRTAAAIIVLCAVAMAAVVMVHKEAMVDEQDLSAEREDAYRDTPDEHLFEHNFEKLVFQQEEKRANKRRQRVRLLPGETMHLEMDMATQPASKMADALEPHTAPEPIPEDENPITADTLPPMHASVRTGKVIPYSRNKYAAKAVTDAQGVATAALRAGENDRTAYKQAQDAAAKVVVRDATEEGGSPAFSRTIKAAAYRAKMEAIKAIEAGKSPAAAKLAAHDAAQSVVKDERAIEQAVPVPNALAQLLNNVDNLWGRMKGKLNNMAQVLHQMPHECHKAKVHALKAHKKMKATLQQAKTHIAVGRKHQTAMLANLLVAQQNAAHASELRQSAKSYGRNMAFIQAQADRVSTKALQASEVSARLHKKVSRQLNIAGGFLDLASKQHEESHAYTLQCKAERALARFGDHSAKRKAAEAKSKAQTGQQLDHMMKRNHVLA